MEIQYSDGHKIEKKIYNLVKDSPSFSSLDYIYSSPCEWAVEYHLSPCRANLLRPFHFKNLEVLDLGAGMGAVSHYLAEECAHLTVVEGTLSRFSVIKQRLREFHNWEGHVGNLFEIHLPKKFDVICLIGVLEYAELFISTPAPFLSLLEKAKSYLKEDGVLILAIENKLGLKYWLGCKEDHLQKPFVGICDYPPSPTPKTFSRKELIHLLNQTGFEHTKLYYPFPDYKIVKCVISSDLARLSPELCSNLSTQSYFQNYGSPTIALFPEVLAQKSLTRAGLFEDFSNSFLILGTRQPNSSTLSHITRRESKGELGWYYSNNRKVATQTYFTREASSDSLRVSKTSILTPPIQEQIFTGKDISIKWSQLPPHAVKNHLPLRTQMAKEAYFKTGRNLLPAFLSWVFSQYETDKFHLRGEAIDAVFTNAVIKEDGSFELFDIEWELLSPFPKTWCLLRNLIALSGQNQKVYGAILRGKNLKTVYYKMCREVSLTPEYETDLNQEAALQALVTPVSDQRDIYLSLKRGMEEKILRTPYPNERLSLKERVPFLVKEKLKSYPHLYHFLKEIRTS